MPLGRSRLQRPKQRTGHFSRRKTPGRSFAKARIERLRSAILSAREEVAILEADYDDTPNNEARQQRVAALQTSIANCDKEIQILSDAMADEN